MYCKNCGNAVPDGKIICPNCGCLIEGANFQNQKVREKIGKNYVPEKQKEPNKFVGVLVILGVLIVVILLAIFKFMNA